MKFRERGAGLPVKTIDGNVIGARGSLAAVYRLDTVSFAFLSEAEKIKLHERLAWWMLKAQASFSIYRVCREYPADAYVDNTVSMIDERYADRARWESLLELHADHLTTMHSFVPEVYVVISLRTNQMIPWRRSGQSAKLVRDAEQAALQAMTETLRARRATTLEIQWLLRRASVRGVCEPDVDPCWSSPVITLDGGAWEADKADIQRFMPAVREHGRHVECQSEDGESRQTFLAFGALPKESDFPGSAELMFAPLETLDFPADVVAHVRWIPNKTMQRRADDARKDALNAIDDAAARMLDMKTARRNDETRYIQDYYNSEPYPPGLDASISIAVGAPDKSVLDERVERLRRAYGSLRLFQSYALQTPLFGDHLLRPDGAQVRDYKRLVTREQLAAMMPIASHHAGSDTGLYIGYTIPGAARPVRYSPLEASQRNRAGAVIMCGSLGGGKTMASQLLCYQAEHRGSLVVDIDPRPDHSFERLPGMQSNVHVISLADVDYHRGLLDPLVVAPPQLREELASGYMMEVLPDAHPEWQTEIIDAVRTVMREPNPSSRAVVDLLLSRDDPAAVAAGKALSVWAEWSLGKLAFGDGTPQEIDVTRNVTTIKGALQLPPAGTERSHYDQTERLSVATLKLIAAYAMRLVSGDVSTHKMLLLDEAHALTGTADGRRFLERLIRMGRSMNVTVVLSTQLIGDLGELNELIGTRFVFRQDTDAQARLNLAALGLDSEDERLIGMLRGFEEGRCLMRGLDGRVAAIRFDVSDSEFLSAADTNPTTVNLSSLVR